MTEKLKNIIEDELEAAYAHGHTDAKAEYRELLDEIDKIIEEAHQKGLDDAWGCARKLFSEMSDTEINLVFPQEWNNGGFKALMALKPKDAIDRINAFERKQESNEIKVGDEVKDRTDDCGVVTGIYGNDTYVLWQDGSTGDHAADELIKTGRHFNFLASLLEAMKEGAK